ncbi:hypothetical protein [Thalassotalea sp. SU-HH00458]|uniref:hypothetical protein n=1 Tax=Thalassotalea sp. SU-HH00458 TaxID=3127657 RepID=UPI003109643A
MKFLPYILFSMLITGCSTNGVNRDNQNLVIQEYYAEVSHRKEVQLASDVPSGIIGGSIIGALDQADGNSDDIISGAIVGAVFGGLFTRLSEGDSKAYEYHLYTPELGAFTLIQKQKVDITSGCLLVSVSSITQVYEDNIGKC